MTTTESGEITTADLKTLAGSAGPCITIVIPSAGAAEFRIELKDVLQEVQKELGPNGELLEPVRQAIENIGPPPKGSALVILRSPEVFEHFWTDETSKESIVVGEAFNLRPLVSLAERQKVFYILALSQRHTRVLRCTKTQSEELALPPGTPTSLGESKQTRQPDHDLQNMSSGGPSTGSMRGVISGSSSDRDDKDEYLLHFFQDIDKAMHALMHHGNIPLVAVGVESELAMYRRVNTYPYLVEPGVHGSPDGLKGGEMHKRALELLEAGISDSLRGVLENFDKQVGTGHASVHAQEIVKAAYEGRVSHLLFQENAQYEGTFDEIRQKVKRHDDPIDAKVDLINLAVAQTLLHGGQASMLPADKMPNGVPLAAIFRYAAPERQNGAGD